MRLFPHIVCSLCLIALSACTSRSVEASHATPAEAEETSSGGDSPLANDFVRTTLRDIHDRCATYVASLEEDVDDVAEREDVARVIAAAAYAVGEIADGTGDAEVMGRTGAGARSCMETPNDPGCGVTPLPSASAGVESPIHRDTVSARMTASDRIRGVNRTLDALDDFVFSRPDPARWSESDAASWVRLRDDASRECGVNASAAPSEEH